MLLRAHYPQPRSPLRAYLTGVTQPLLNASGESNLGESNLGESNLGESNLGPRSSCYLSVAR